MQTAQPQDINFFTTYQCNSRCSNCHIWKGGLVPPSKVAMDDKTLNRLFTDPLFSNCSGIGLAGGEPTIAPFTWRLLELVSKKKPVTITTNALNSGKLLELLKATETRERFTVQLSLDGIGDENDRVRGIQGAYQRTFALLTQLESLGIRRLISFTINRLNFHQLLSCYELAVAHGAMFSARIAYSGGAYANKDNKDVYRLDHEALLQIDLQVHAIIGREIRSPDHSPAKLVFLRKMTDYHQGAQRDLACYAMQTGMVIDLYGNVFPNCPVMMRPVGNLHDAGLTGIWQSDQAGRLRRAIEKMECGGCWNDCQVVTNIAMDQDFLDREYAGLKTDVMAEAIPHSLPVVLDFNNSDSSLLLSGWYGVEGEAGCHYRWTQPQFSLMLPRGTVSLKLFALFPDSIVQPGLQLELFIDGERKCAVFIDGGGWRDLAIDLPAPAAAAAVARFRLSSSYCPLESGDGNDVRRLGVAVRKIAFA